MTDREFLARIDATLDATARLVMPPPLAPVTGDVVCSPLSFVVRATK